MTAAHGHQLRTACIVGMQRGRSQSYLPFSVTLVFGCRAAAAAETHRPLIAERL